MTYAFMRAAARITAILGGLAVANSAAGQTAGDATRGRSLFGRTCVACHGANGTGSALAPPLVRVTGRRAGAANFKYSPAMKNARVIWTAVTLDSYLKSPVSSIPGSRMPVGVGQAKDRSDIIAFLGTLR
jgi:cytochrome c2